MNINLPKYNQTVYAELLQAMVWNNKCALCAATGTDKSYIAACNSLSYCYFGAERSIVGSVSWKF